MSTVQTLQTFSIDKNRVFVSGLFWQPFQGGKENGIKKVKQDAAELKVDLCVYYHGKTFQAGMALSKDGAANGMYSVAACVASFMESVTGAANALVAVPVPGRDDLWLCVVQRDGVILPDGDLIGSEDAIHSHLAGMYSVGDWGSVIAPIQWGFPDSTEKRFEEFLPKDKKAANKYKPEWRIAPIHFSLSGFARKLAIPVVVLALGSAGYFGYTQWQIAQIKARQAALVAGALEADKPHGQADMPKPWLTDPSVDDFVAGCVAAINTAPLWVGDWKLKTAQCDGKQVAISWSKNNGWVSHLLKAVPGAVISTDGASASLSIPFQQLPPANSLSACNCTANSLSACNCTANEDVLPSVLAATTRLQAAQDALGERITLTQVSAPPPLPGAPPVTPVNPFNTITFDIKQSRFSPPVLAQFVNAAGVRLTGITLNQDMTWDIKGIQYADQANTSPEHPAGAQRSTGSDNAASIIKASASGASIAKANNITKRINKAGSAIYY